MSQFGSLLLCCTLVIVKISTGAAQEKPNKLPDQVLILRDPQQSSLKITHFAGDSTALITMKPAIKDAKKILSSQRGPFIKGVHHDSLASKTLVLRLELTTDAGLFLPKI